MNRTFVSASARRSGRSRCGISLIEMTVVILLMGIVAAVAQPRFSEALSDYRVAAAAERVRSDLKYARVQARVRSQLITVRFFTGDTTTGSFYRFEQIPPPGNANSDFDETEETTWYRIDLTEEPYGVALRSAPASVSFDMYGKATGAATLEVALGGRSRQVSVDPSSGEIEVE